MPNAEVIKVRGIEADKGADKDGLSTTHFTYRKGDQKLQPDKKAKNYAVKRWAAKEDKEAKPFMRSKISPVKTTRQGNEDSLELAYDKESNETIITVSFGTTSDDYKKTFDKTLNKRTPWKLGGHKLSEADRKRINGAGDPSDAKITLKLNDRITKGHIKALVMTMRDKNLKREDVAFHVLTLAASMGADVEGENLLVKKLLGKKELNVSLGQGADVSRRVFEKDVDSEGKVFKDGSKAENSIFVNVNERLAKFDDRTVENCYYDGWNIAGADATGLKVDPRTSILKRWNVSGTQFSGTEQSEDGKAKQSALADFLLSAKPKEIKKRLKGMVWTDKDDPKSGLKATKWSDDPQVNEEIIKKLTAVSSRIWFAKKDKGQDFSFNTIMGRVSDSPIFDTLSLMKDSQLVVHSDWTKERYAIVKNDKGGVSVWRLDKDGKFFEDMKVNGANALIEMLREDFSKRFEKLEEEEDQDSDADKKDSGKEGDSSTPPASDKDEKEEEKKKAPESSRARKNPHRSK